jgi:hypothetical protein
MDPGMEAKLAKLRAALHDLKNAGMLRKAFMAEAALLAAVALMEEMVEEIEKLKSERGSAGK